MAFALGTVGRFVSVRAERAAEIKSTWICPKGWVDNLDILFGDGFWVVAVVFVEALLKSIIHSIDCGLAIFVAGEGVEIGFLDEKEN